MTNQRPNDPAPEKEMAPKNSKIISITINYQVDGVPYWIVLDKQKDYPGAIITDTVMGARIMQCLNVHTGSVNLPIQDNDPCGSGHPNIVAAGPPSGCCYLVNDTWVCY